MVRRIVFFLVVVLLATAEVLHSSGGVNYKQTPEERKELAVRQNEQADIEGLQRLTEEMLQEFVRYELLVPLPDNFLVRTDPRLDPKYRYCQPWVLDFLLDLAEAYYFEFLGGYGPIQVNSAVRTVEKQRLLTMRRLGKRLNPVYNANAAPIEGPKRSSHMTGSTIDISKLKGNTEWLREYLWQKFDQGEIILVEENSQAVFHVMVFKHYGKEKSISTQ